ncbi:MAG: radical SAM protein, partial [Bacteroidetes bacterium]|nr:radical SAM protein [Bacteroidota bacterium]
MSVKKKIAFHTLGCKLNFSETSAVSRLFDTEEYTRVDFNDRADIYIINTCTVTGNADRKCRQAIKKAIASSSDAIVIVMGCYSQLYADEVKNITGISLVTGTGDKSGLPELIGELSPSQKARIIISPPENYNAFSPSWSQDDRTRSFLKIQDGCNYFCSYCTVPYARGRSRNGSVADITSLAKQIAGSGVREIVLSGVNIGDYGKTTGESLYDLLCSLESVDGIDRIRLSSVEPDLLND